MDTTIETKPIELHHTGVPVDQRDPNHPHFPGDIESRPFKHSFMTKKARWITSLVVLAIASVITAIIVGATLGMGMAKKPAHTIVTSTASAEVEKVYTTTNVFSTSVVTHFHTQDPTTIKTTTTRPAPKSVIVTTTLDAPTPTPTPEPPKEEPPKPPETPKDEPHPDFERMCYIGGNFGTDDECQATCKNLVQGRVAHCEVDTNAMHKCVICKA
jgi:hypothetical protein